jgi:hypothetical protein
MNRFFCSSLQKLAILLFLLGFCAHSAGLTDQGCGLALEQLLKRAPSPQAEQLRDHKDSSRHILAAEISHHGDDRSWYQLSLSANLRQAISERLNFAEYLEHGLKPGEHVMWLQQAKLKELNEEIWDIGGTEYYLLALDRNLTRFFQKNPKLGRVIHRNYKDRVMVSTLSDADFAEKVVGPLKAAVLTELHVAKQSAASTGLDDVASSMSFASGSSVVEAHINLKLKALGMTFPEWKKAVFELRGRLVSIANSRTIPIPFQDLMKVARRYRDDPAILIKWLNARGMGSGEYFMLRRYRKLLALADFLPINPPPKPAEIAWLKSLLEKANKSPIQLALEIPEIQEKLHFIWDISRSLFLRNSLSAGYIMAVDIKGLGEKAMLAQDAWVEGGANLTKLPEVYNKTSQFLAREYEKIEETLTSEIRSDVIIATYISGDDALISMHPLTEYQKRRSDQLMLERHSDAYFKGTEVAEPGNAVSLAHAIHGARAALFSSKGSTENIAILKQ